MVIVTQIVENSTSTGDVAELLAFSFAAACKPLAAIQVEKLLNNRLSSISNDYVPVTHGEVIFVVRLRLKSGKAADVFDCKAELLFNGKLIQ